MNLHAVAARAVSAVNPQMTATLQRSIGYTTAADGSRTPSFATTTFGAQVQPLAADELTLIDSLNIQGIKRAIYMNGFANGLVRPQSKGGDLVSLPATPEFPNGSTWLTVIALETWADWSKIAVVLQTDTPA